jgi:iron complex outermembrane receptor protein
LQDQLVLVTGLRYTKEDKNFIGDVYQNINTDDRVIEIDLNSTSLEHIDTDNNQNLWSAKVQLEYSTDTDLYYVGVNRGVKADNFNTPLFGGFSSYKPEK